MPHRTTSSVARTLLVPLVFALLGPVCAVADDATPDAATIRARIEAAAGPQWAQERTVLAVRHDGTTETRTTWRKGGDFREDDVEGPFETQSGSIHGQRWRQSENGVTVLVQPEPGHERSSPSTTTVRRVTTPVGGYMLETLDRQGYGLREYVDPATWHVIRRESIVATGTTTTVFDDFRTADGRTSAWHWVQSDGHAEDAQDARVVESSPGPVSVADVAMRGFRRDLFTFPSGTERVDLPIHVEDGQVYVRAEVGDRGLDLALDSGASYLTLSSDVAQQLGLKISDQQSVITTQRYTTGRAILPYLKIGPFEMHNIVVRVLPPMWTTSRGDIKGAGLLGFDFLAQAAFKVDYEHSLLSVFPSDAFPAPHAPHMVTLDIRLATGQPQTTVAINGTEADRFIVDTGGAGTLLFYDYFARRYPDVLDREILGESTRRFLGIGGSFGARPYQLSSLRLDTVTFTNVVAYAVTARGPNDSNADGLIGSAFLQLFDVWIDYTNSRIYLVPNDNGRRAAT